VISFLNENAGAVTALVTVALLLVTAFYAWTTYKLVDETRQSRLFASQPRVVAYLRANEVHANIVQLCIANLSGAAASGVSASIAKETEWPTTFYFENSAILRDLKFLRPHEILKFDLGMGPDLFRDKVPAVFKATIKYADLDGRAFVFEDTLKVESVEGHSHFQIYGIDDVARRLMDISETLKSFTGFRRLRVETFDKSDREAERSEIEERIEKSRKAAVPRKTVGQRVKRLLRRKKSDDATGENQG
jgi:hypothetical protein